MKIERGFFFNITYACDNSCIGCVSKYTKLHSSRIIRLEDVVKINKKFNFTESDRFIISGGEPLLNPEVIDIVSYLASYSTHIILYTNGRKLKKMPLIFFSQIERIIIPFYGLNDKHDEYTNVSGSFNETLESIYTLRSELIGHLDLKFVVRNEIIAKDFFGSISLKSLVYGASYITVCGYIDPLYRRSYLDIKTVREIETMVQYVLQMGITVKLYDIPLCMFSKSFVERIMGCYIKSESVEVNDRYCCSVGGKYRKVKYNEPPNYSSLCSDCKMNSICSMVLKRYSVLAINSRFCYLDTE